MPDRTTCFFCETPMPGGNDYHVEAYELGWAPDCWLTDDECSQAPVCPACCGSRCHVEHGELIANPCARHPRGCMCGSDNCAEYQATLRRPIVLDEPDLDGGFLMTV